MKLLFPFTLNRNSKQAKGLIFWGSGGHGSGNLFDFSGQFDNGQINGSVIKWVTGVDGGQTAISYDGSTSRTALVSSNPFPVSTGISVACWVKTSTTARYQYLMVRWGVAGGSDSWHLRLDQTTGFVYWNVSTSGSYQAGNDLNGTTNVADGKWHLVVATYDGVNEKIYVDGQLQATVAVTGTIFQTSNTVSFGGLSDGSTSSNWLLGSMDDPRIWNYALPASVVKEMYQPATRWQLRYKPNLRRALQRNASVTTNENVSQSLTISQSATSVKNLNRTVSQPLTISQAVVVVDDTIQVSQPLTITQSVVVKAPNQKVSQSLTISQTLSRSGSQFAHSASNSLSLIQVADESKFKPRSVSQSLTVTQSATYVKTTGLSNSLTITQSAAYQYAPHLELSTQNLVIAQTLAEVAIRPRAISQSLIIVQAATKSKIITKSLSQSLVISQNALNTRNTTTHQSLTVAQSVVVGVFRNNPIPTQSLHITQSVHVQLILNRSVTSNLVLLHEHQVPNGQGGFITIPNLLYAKGGPGDNACCPISGGTTYFQAPSRAIILPNPEFGDGEANVGAVKIIRTITGGTFSYVKKSVNRKLKYKFHITQKKAFELRQFLLDFLATRLMMTNWKGEMWNGYFLSDPAEITSITRGEPCIGDLYEVELDFQGIRIN